MLIRQAQSQNLTIEEKEKWSLFLSSTDNLWTAGSRLAHTELTEDGKFPIYLPKGHHLTNLIISNQHEKLIHAGITHTLFQLRRRFWIPRGRAAVKSVISNCMTCKRWKAKTFKLPAMPNLPESRVIDQEHSKRARREEGIVWRNTIPKAPWGDGVYERVIGKTKQALRRAIGRKLLKEKEFMTLIVQIEAILHTRPLTYVGTDDYRVIRPTDFISPTFTLRIPIKTNEEDEEYTPYPLRSEDKAVECWKQVLKTLDVFWNRWRDEYLPSLRERTQRKIVSPRSVETRELQENEVLLLAEPDKPRATWKLAKIINLKRGRDGCIRSAKIQLPNGRHLERSINQLYPLELTKPDRTKEEQLETKSERPYANQSNGDVDLSTEYGKTRKNEDKELEQPIASRTRKATQQSTQNGHTITNKSNNLTKTLFVMTILSATSNQTVATKNCKWTSGIPFNIPERWNCDNITNQNVTLHTVDVYTNTHVRIPAIQLHEWYVQRPFSGSLSVVSDHTITVATSSTFCRALHTQRQIDGISLTQISPNKWITTNEIQYSYGWLGINCQSTINFILIEGEILFFDGKYPVSNLDNTNHCKVQRGKCVTNTRIVLWNNTKATHQCLYNKVGRLDAMKYSYHFVINELQASFLMDKTDHTIIDTRCGFNNPHSMKGNIILDVDNVINENITTPNQTRKTTNQLLLMEISPEETFNPNSVKFQYIFDSLRREFLQLLKVTYQRSCQNRNNLLYLIERMSEIYPTIATEMILQRNDIIAKKDKRVLLVAPCKTNVMPLQNIEFSRGLINKFEIERINAELELLNHYHDTINSISYQQEDDSFWKEFTKEGQQLVNRLVKEFDQAE
ncbi:unnamed protein product, partial [Onchocerca ochengi]|uniref:Integrase catalytic domain-containing protein n=1 Tax=Onchocerca ochengi TaxID=42157 RepID=A0A182EPJ5_ONCOC